MSKGANKKNQDARREERRRAQMAAMQQRAEHDVPGARREHIQGADIAHNEEKYEPLLFAVESGLVEVFHERERLPIDDEAERALRLLIARFEGDSARRSGSPDVDALADAANRNIERLFRRSPLLSRAEIIGCIRRVITSIRTHHDPANPRAYFEFVEEFVHEREQETAPSASPTVTPTGLWVPGQPPPAPTRPSAGAPRRPGGLWVPGDEP